MHRFMRRYIQWYTVDKGNIWAKTAEKSLLGMLWGNLHLCIPTIDMASSSQQALVQEAYKADANVEPPGTASGTAHLVQISIW